MSLEERASVCTFDCPDTCSLTVTVDDGRVAKVHGSRALPYTAGVICTKVARDMGTFAKIQLLFGVLAALTGCLHIELAFVAHETVSANYKAGDRVRIQVQKQGDKEVVTSMSKTR